MVEPPAGNADSPAGLDQNIDSVLEVRNRELEQRSPAQRFLERVSRFIARPVYLMGVVGFSVVWIAANLLAPRLGLPEFDPSPFSLLDGILSLAALITTTVVLIAQNLQTRSEQRHAHISLQVNLMTEQKVAKVINLLEELRRDMPMVKDRYDPQAASLSEKTDALDVLAAIEAVGLGKDPSETGPQR